MQYNTKQGREILEFITSCTDFVTVADIMEYIGKNSLNIGQTTVYRHLERLEEEGKITKHVFDGKQGAFYTKKGSDALLKCEHCGRITKLDCPDLDHLYRHFEKEHAINISASKTVFYGECEKCLKGEKNV